MASRDNYTVGWICALPLEMAAAKAILDQVHPDLPAETSFHDTNSYILGSLHGHNVVVACLPAGVYGTTSAATVAVQMLNSFKSIRFSLMVGIGAGVPGTKEDIRLGDIVVSRPTASQPGIVQYDFGKRYAEDQILSTGALNKPPTLLLTAAGKVETNAILGESQTPAHLHKIVQKDPFLFTHPGPQQDILFDADYEHVTESIHDTCSHCDPQHIHHRTPRNTLNPRVHYGLIASGNQVIRNSRTRDRLAREHGVLCFEMEAAGLMDVVQCLIIRGICDYADTHKTKRWQGYAAAVAAAYAKELLSLIPTVPKPEALASITDSTVSSVLEALLLTRPEVDRSSLIALKGRRVDGTCEWLVKHSSYEEWLQALDPPLLWISGGPGKGKTMLAIYITEELQPVVDSSCGILLYYFCSNRDKTRNSALTILRGILHQWLRFRPHLAQHVWSYFDGAETTKYTVSSFICLWRVFMILLNRDNSSSQVALVLDGLDECEEDSLKQLLHSLSECLLDSEQKSRPRFKVIILSRPQIGPLESILRPFRRIKFDDSDVEVGKDVERYISAKVAELAAEQILSPDRLEQVRQALTTQADGTFLWVGFVANELKGRSWIQASNILRRIPKGLVGIYRRLLEQVEDKEKLVPILQWVVLAARPLTLDELAVASEIEASSAMTPIEILKDRLTSCGLLVKVEGDVVNLVHESAREFFQSEQIKIDGSSIFYMSHKAHGKLTQTCLALIEGSYQSPGSISSASLHDSLLQYASLYWPEHFKHAFGSTETRSDFSRRFFQAESAVREDWWSFYWQWEQAGGTPPSFTLLHLAAYFGNLAWAKMLLERNDSDSVPFRHYASQKDSYGRTPLFWAATRGHRDVAELLLDHGAHINTKDRNKMTALHIAVTGEHSDVVSLLLERSANIEAKAYYGETPLMRAIQASSRDIVKLLLEHGARVDDLPVPLGAVSLKGVKEPLQERAKQLMLLQEQLFAARFENQSKLVELTLKILAFSVRFRPFFKLVSLYVRHWSLGRWEVLQDLVKNNETARLREWAQSFASFGRQLVEAKNPKNLESMTHLSVQVFKIVSSADLEALLVIGVMVGSNVILKSAQLRWRQGVEISGRTFSQFASLAYQRGAEESLDYGVRQFLIDFDAYIRKGDGQMAVDRTVVMFGTLLAILAGGDQQPAEYFTTVIREFYEGYIGGPYAESLFNDVSQACANEFGSISECRDSRRLALVLNSIIHVARSPKEKGRDWFLNVPPAACQILCQESPETHGWLVSEGVPDTLSALLSRQADASLRRRGIKALVECLVIGRQYGLKSPAEVRARVKQHLNVAGEVDGILDGILNS